MTGTPVAFHDIARLRLRSQCIVASPNVPGCTSPREAVERLGALQGQDYAGALWSIGLRVPGTTERSVEEAFARREIVRTWPMRGTLHVIPAADVRWMLELLTPRVIARTAQRRANLALDDDALARATRLVTGALRGGNRLTREEMMALLEGGGIATTGQRGYHILFNLSMHRVIVFGPRAGTQQTFALFDEWLPDARSLPRDQSLALIVKRYFTGHAPASAKDFAGWSGLTSADVKAGLAANADSLVTETIEGITYWMPRGSAGELVISSASDAARSASPSPDAHLLPGFDEYLLGYKDRSAILHADHSERIIPGGNGVFKPTVVIDGQVKGTWRRVSSRGAVGVEATPFVPLSSAESRAVETAAHRYRAFVV